MWGIDRSPVNSPHKGPVTRKTFAFDDSSWYACLAIKTILWPSWSYGYNMLLSIRRNTNLLTTGNGLLYEKIMTDAYIIRVGLLKHDSSEYNRIFSILDVTNGLLIVREYMVFSVNRPRSCNILLAGVFIKQTFITRLTNSCAYTWVYCRKILGLTGFDTTHLIVPWIGDIASFYEKMKQVW